MFTSVCVLRGYNSESKGLILNTRIIVKHNPRAIMKMYVKNKNKLPG